MPFIPDYSLDNNDHEKNKTASLLGLIHCTFNSDIDFLLSSEKTDKS